MNYIRGAVSAISAPYQYYKDLPPINPSTLTGAIDVIVIQRPTSNGGTELACSPFHVRFGKWQVLRPSEKKVNVSVNGHPIPFDMKIGEAGEAFFVLETEDDVPDDLITSPVLKPTTPDEPSEASNSVTPGRFGAKEEKPTPDEEPDYFDLDARPSSEQNAASSNQDHPITPSPTPPLSQAQDTTTRKSDVNPLPSPPPSPGKETVQDEVDRRADAALKRTTGKDVPVPSVEYRSDVALDTEGYHSKKRSKKSRRSSAHAREWSDRTIRADDDHDDAYGDDAIQFPSSESPPPDSDHEEQDNPQYRPTIPFPSLRATSEPPPDILDSTRSSSLPLNSISSSSISSSRPKITSNDLSSLTPVQEYSWEWGAFPQPSPMKTSFPKSGLRRGSGVPGDDEGPDDILSSKLTGSPKGKSRLIYLEEDSDEEGRSRSVPPTLDESPRMSRKLLNQSNAFSEGYGAGGRLSGSKSDPTKFRVIIEGRKVEFELSLVQYDDETEDIEESYVEEESRGRKHRTDSRRGAQVRVYSPDGRWKGIDEFETARLFDKRKVTFRKFIEDHHIVEDPRLVIRWPGDQYITRDDGSPLMEALRIWRDSYFAKVQEKAKTAGLDSAPLSDDEAAKSGEEDHDRSAIMERSKSEPPENNQIKAGKPPTSSSWVKWWSRSRKSTASSSTDVGLGVPGSQKTPGRPELKETHSEPPFIEKKSSKSLANLPPAESAPVPSTPVQKPVPDAHGTPAALPAPGKKYVKTLRLTSEQLKALNLKPGPNTITFSLSMTGAIACTARIFVWDHTDSVVISDIDGTITKSDGLGHVFAMIGRDWTHLGVAKLYTDICRNGYKILYLTSRAIGQADATRGYLKGIKQNDYQLPEGPVIMSPDRLMASLHREVIMRKPEVFKMACLRDIQRLFGDASRNPFYAGFGNRITDALSYRSVNVPSSRIFTIDSSGEVKLELLELAGYKSSYIHMTDLVDQMFPPINKKWAPEFTDFNFWRTPMQDFPLPDLSPPSPALSARSDSTTFSRLRNFSLVGTRSPNVSKSIPVSSASSVSGDDNGSPYRSDALRQMSSFERLSSTLGFSGSPRSASPESSSAFDSEGEDDEPEWEWDAEGRRRRTRRRSMTSMPGSLEDMDMDFGIQEEGEEDGEQDEYDDEEYEGEQEEDLDEQAAERAFDEDLLAADDMKNVPFL